MRVYEVRVNNVPQIKIIFTKQNHNKLVFITIYSVLTIIIT